MAIKLFLTPPSFLWDGTSFYFQHYFLSSLFLVLSKINQQHPAKFGCCSHRRRRWSSSLTWSPSFSSCILEGGYPAVFVSVFVIICLGSFCFFLFFFSPLVVRQSRPCRMERIISLSFSPLAGSTLLVGSLGLSTDRKKPPLSCLWFFSNQKILISPICMYHDWVHSWRYRFPWEGRRPFN